MFGLIGERLDYSLSKKIHEAIRPMEYKLIPLNKEKFHDFMTTKNFQGINVTIPYKEAVIPYLDVIDQEAQIIGAINTIINKNGKLYGYNTDVYGFKYLVDTLNLDLKNKNILILGTGGSSKTAYHVLNTYGPALIHKASRTPKNNSISYEQATKNQYDLIVNTTPVGTSPNIGDSPINLDDFPSCQGIIDLIYNPSTTSFIQQGLNKSIKTIGGIDMLYVQAVYANELFATIMDKPTQNYQTIYPKIVSGCPEIPCSKSLAHRSIICGSLGNSNSILTNLDMSIDINSTLEAMKALGAKFNYENKTLAIQPIDYNNLPKEITVNCHESGTTLRLLIPIISALKINATYLGANKLFQRPLDTYEEIFAKSGLDFELQDTCLKVQGGLNANKFALKNLKSSQFATGILLALPLMDGGSLDILDDLQSASYLDLTIDTMKQFGITIQEKNTDAISTKLTIFVEGQYKASNYFVELDYSQLAFFAVLAAIKTPLNFDKININSLQGDKVILDILEKMGANLDYMETHLTISPALLKSITIDAADCPDLVPILMVLACFAQGTTLINNTKRLKYKESPRDKAMAQELSKLGIKVQITENSITINGKQLPQNSSKVDSHNDHRIAMALTILGLSGNHSLEIQNSQAVNKSFPDFFEVIRKISC